MLEAFRRLIRRSGRTEAEIQADVRQFILSAPFELESEDLVEVALESPLGDRRRIDVEAGSAVIEVKRDIRRERTRTDAELQLAGYVDARMQQTGTRYVGVLTDGALWYCYQLIGGQLHEVSRLELDGDSANVEALIVWLEGVLATNHDIAPTALNIEQRLGSRSTSYALDRATVASLFKRNRDNPTVKVKRELWCKLLTSALGTQFTDDDELFIDHTLLVNTSEIIAHAILGLEVESLSPASLLSGDKFDEAGVYGVVEADFFGWVVEVEGGEAFIRTLARRLNRFRWSEVEQDILKILYENFIGAETRKQLGEYYTPDWLAEVIVSEAIESPLTTRVLDPACGSGTFLFHAVRHYIAAAESSGYSTARVLADVTRHVLGMDLHPVAVTLARVTYLLAIGRDRLAAEDRGDIQIPVYLGDSIQWREQGVDLWSAGNLVIRTDDRRDLIEAEMCFPDALLDDAGQFDQLVSELAERASRRRANSSPPPLRAIFSRLAIPEQFHAAITTTFRTMCRLHDEGRDHIWGYYVRNLARPLWLSKPGNQVDVLIGNPPWLAYSHMTQEMQEDFRSFSEGRELWAGGELTPHQDLSALFAVRACELYLRSGGRFALVLPNAALDGAHYFGFRRGRYSGREGVVKVAFRPAWDLRRIRPHFFPRACSVVFGERVDQSDETTSNLSSRHEQAMPDEGQIWTGRLDQTNGRWAEVAQRLSRTNGRVHHGARAMSSPYDPRFTQGAIFAPYFMFVVKHVQTSPLGLSHGRVAIESQRSAYEKKPWKNIQSLSGVVESEFVRPFYAGEDLFPYRIGPPSLAVLPCNGTTLLSSDSIEMFPGFQQWWGQASAIWEANRSSERLSLFQQVDFQSKLSKQLPIPPFRVVYNTSGMHICASKLRDRRGVISSGLYWASVQSEDEADFLCAVLNAPATTELTRPFMSYGKDERHIHKHVWKLPIPMFNPDDPIHRRIIELGAACERLAASATLDLDIHFPIMRRRLRESLSSTSEGQELNEIVFELIS